MGEKSYYRTIELSIKEDVKECEKNFKYISSKCRIREICSRLRDYIDARNSANYYAGREKKNPSCATQRIECEYREQLNMSRIRKYTSMLSTDELQMYVDMLKLRFDDAMTEKDIKKKFRKHDFVLAGCQLCNVEDEEILSKINEIRCNCKDIIEDIRTM